MNGLLRSAPLLAGLVFSLMTSAASAALTSVSIFGPEPYSRSSGQPVTITKHFTSTRPGESCLLQVYNGGLEDSEFELVSSSVIALNGARVVSPNEFNQQISYIEKPVTLNTANDIAVEVRGKPGGGLVLQIVCERDLEPPTITATLSSPANGAGWHKADVTVSFTCSDADSGIASCPAPVIVSTEGAAQIISGEAVDDFGNRASTSVTLNLDTTAPQITAAQLPVKNLFGWNNSDTTVSFSCSDALSGVAQCPADQLLATEGAVQHASGTAVDIAGNSATQSHSVNLDKTPPLITPQLSTPPDSNGWHENDVTVTFDCSDALSGIASCTPPTTVSNEGAAQQIDGSAEGKGGNSAATSITVNLDKAPPTITATSSPLANASGWHNSDVTVSFVCADSGSGIASCTGPVLLATEGAAQIVTGNATDLSGKSATISTTVNLDKTPPQIVATATPAANAAGWHNTDVSVAFTCSDTLSGMAACPAATTASNDGAAQLISGTASDVAGNSAIASVTLNIDRVSPTITASVTPSANTAGWHNGDVTVSFSCSDTGSGIANCPAPVTLSLEGAGQVVNGTATDAAGNSATTTITLGLDKTSPTITATVTPVANPANWHSSEVTVTFTCNDEVGGSGIVGCPAPVTLTADVTGQSVSGMTTDMAGNSATTSVILNIDTAPPVIAATAAPAANSVGWHNSDVTVSFACSDAGSGIKDCPPPVVVGIEGADQLTGGSATDIAGNSGAATITLNIDKTAPIILVSSPSEGQVLNESTVIVSGSVTELETLSSLTVNGASLMPAIDGSFTYTLTIAEGSNTITVTGTDLAGNSSSNIINVTLVLNQPPAIISTPVTAATENTPYSYDVDASDPDAGDQLVYSLAVSPFGMAIDGVSGLIQWNPTAADLGDQYVTVRVADDDGAEALQGFTITVEATPNNPPEITSTPITTVQEGQLYNYDIDAIDIDSSVLSYSLETAPAGMTIDPITGVISWAADPSLAGSVVDTNLQCQIPARSIASVDKAADVIVVIDVSGSMPDEVAWISGAISRIDAELLKSGVGTGTLRNQYGLVIFGNSAASVQVGGSLFGSISDFVRAGFDLKAENQLGFIEDGLLAVQFAIDNYPFRDEAAKNIILITDEARTSQNSEITVASVTDELLSRDITLNAVVTLASGFGSGRGVICSDNVFGFGLDSQQRGFRMIENGSFAVCENARFQDTLIVREYPVPALDSGGATWDLDLLRQGGNAARSFSKAIIKTEVNQVIDDLPARLQADLVVQDLEIDAATGRVIVTVLNRGLTSSDLAVISLNDGQGQFLGENPVAALGSSENADIAFDVDVSSIDALQAQITIVDSSDATAECDQANNTLTTPIVRARVTDEGNGADTQTFLIDVTDVNSSPVITSVPDVAPIFVGQPYRYQVIIDDADLGDNHSYQLLKTISNGFLDKFTGEFTIVPEPVDIGQHEMTIVVRDLAGNEAFQTFVLIIEDSVAGSYILPRFEEVTTVQHAIVNQTYMFESVVVADPRANLNFSILTSPEGMTIDATTGVIAWQVPPGDIGRIESVALMVADQFDNRDILAFEVFKDEVNVAPQFSSAAPFSRRAIFASPQANYGNRIDFTDANVRESFNLELDAAPQGMNVEIDSPTVATLLTHPGKFTPASATLGWDRQDITATTTYPERVRNFDYLCRTPGATVAATPVYISWELARNASLARAAPILDTNNDTIIDTNDRPMILANGGAAAPNNLYAVDAMAQSLLWSETRYTLNRLYPPAVADLDADGIPEILLVERDLSLIAIRSDDRSLVWRSTVPVRLSGEYFEEINVADLDGDGLPEIIASTSVFDRNGQLLWRFEHTAPNRFGTPLPVDLDLDGVQEVVFGGQIRDVQGNLLNTIVYPNADDRELATSYTAPVNLDADDNPELLLVDNVLRSSSGSRQYTVSMVNHDGSFIWGPVVLRGGMGKPVIGDINGNGSIDIYMPGSRVLLAASTGEQLWATSTPGTGDIEKAVGIDFNNDGIMEILTLGGLGITFYDGQSGVLLKQVNTSGSRMSEFSTPMIVDLDGDSDPEIAAVSNQIIAVFETQSEKQVPSSYTQGMLAQEFLNADLAVNVNPPRSWLTHNTFGVVAPANNTFAMGLPDLRVSAPTGDYENEISVEVVNRGTADYSSPFSVQIFAGDPDANGTLLASQDIQQLSINQAVALNYNGVVPSGYDGELIAHVEPSATVAECRTNNNDASAWPIKYTLTDHAGLTTSQAYALPVEHYSDIQFLFDPVPRATEKDLFQFTFRVNNVDDNNSFSFDIASAPAGLTIDPQSGLLSWMPARGQAGSHLVTLYVRSLTQLRQHTFSITVDPAPPNSVPEIISAAPTGVAVGELYRYDVDATDADGDTLTYSLIESVVGMTIDAANGLIEWTPTLDQLGSQQYRVQVNDNDGGTAQQIVTVTVVVPNSAPIIASTPPQVPVVTGLVYNYDVNAIDADGDALTYRLDTAPVGMTIANDTGAISWLPVVNQIGQNDVVIHVSDGQGGIASQSFTLVVSEPNNLPEITSVPVTSALADNLYRYQLIVSDIDNQILLYSLPTAPSGMSIDAQGLIEWTPTLLQLNDYIVTVNVDDQAGGIAIQEFTIAVRDANANNAPLIESEAIIAARTGTTYQYAIQASDADNDTLSYQLSQAPAGMTISGNGFISWLPIQAQTAGVTVDVSDGIATTQQQWSIEVVDGDLVADIQLQPEIPLLGETTLISVLASNAAGPVTRQLTIDGADVPLDENGQVMQVFTRAGEHSLIARVNDLTQLQTISFTFRVRDPGDTEPPEITGIMPAANTFITAPTDVVVSINDDNLENWSVSFKRTGSVLEQTLASGTQPVNSQIVAQIDPTMLVNGMYIMTVQANDLNGKIFIREVPLIIKGGLKVGNFSMTFEDLNIPVSGIPIQVMRSYDSRRRHESLDFGHGWSIDYQNIEINESNEPTTDWYRSQESKVFTIDGNGVVFPANCMRSTNARTVTVTLPNDDVEVFAVRLRGLSGSPVSDNDPDCELIADTSFSLLFDPEEGTTSTLEAYANGLMFFNNGNLVADIIEIEPVNITKYRLTTKNGFVYDLDQDFGIEIVTDPNGNSLTYTDGGIIHSDGKSVLFNRNADGRITTITDPMGNELAYSYSSGGDLIGATDAELNTTSYQYSQEVHYLTDILDPLGRTVLKNIYDASGRLIAQEDQDGNRTDFNHDIAGRLSIVTDRLGRTTQFSYDDRGNVTNQVDALGNITSFTYDADDNQLSQTDALGNISTATYNSSGDQLTQTDPLGNTVAFSYNSLGQELTIDDARGNRFTNTYDGAGNLLTITDPQGNVAGQNINFKGYVTLRQDALGNNTTFLHNFVNGNLLEETDALGNKVTMTYDDNGNRLSETRSRMINGLPVDEVTTFAYDNLDRLISTTGPLGNTTQTEYDAMGNESATIDALGQRTELVYDAYRRLIQTTYPDLTTETNSYDLEGNLLSTSDRLGRTTSYDYDALNRQTQVTYPDGTTTQTEYDAVGRVTAEIDERGNRTTHDYDAAGRRISTTDALLNTTTFSYDVDGNLVSQLDANGYITTFEYGSLDRRIRTVFHDLTEINEGYDALGRLTSKNDQAGKTTSYEYDALGRLTAVVDALLQRTTYSYDEVGNKLTQTDANGNTTSWTYDAVGRVLTRTLPMGQVESFTYDANGNQTSKTDFNGTTTTFEYGSNNRLTRTVYADLSEETFAYDAVGNRTSASNAQGTTSYTYDSRDRLVSETQSNGNVIGYSYDAAGNRTEVTTTVNAVSETTTYGYDVLNRLSSVTDFSLNVTNYTYDAVGNRASVGYPNGNTTSYTYDSLNRLTDVTTRDSLNNVIASFDYTLLITGHRQQVIDQTGATTIYTYDDLYRLTDEDLMGHLVLGSASNEYQYDPVGNRTFSVEDGVSTAYTYDDNDRLLTAGGETYAYDDNGNTLTMTIDNTLTTNSYDHNNRLIRMVKTESTVTVDDVSYGYDVDGLRVATNDDGDITNYLVDKNRDYGQVIKELDSTNTATVSYLYGDDLIKQSRASNDSYYLYDGLGSTRALSDDLGNVVGSYDYSAYGVTLNQTGTIENSYLYTGEQYDQSLGLYNLRARYMDPSIGRFTQMDTWMGRSSDPVTLHKYLYANVDPVNNIDPSGNFSLGQAMAGVNVASTLASTAQTTMEVFSLATGDGEVSARKIGAGIILGMLPGASGLKLLKMSNLKKKVNGNSKKSQKPQHVYKIDDTLEFDIYKYGISGEALNKNGSSRRANTQANKLNRPLTFKRYVPKVLFRNVPGRIAALAIEKSLVCAYNKSKGRNPDGNKRPLCH